jgi:hypothetical protein
MHLRRVQMQPVVVDDIDVGPVAGRNQAAVREADRQRGLARLRLGRDHSTIRFPYQAGKCCGRLRMPDTTPPALPKAARACRVADRGRDTVGRPLLMPQLQG